MSLTAAEEYKLVSQISGTILPAGTSGTPIYQTFDRRYATGSVFQTTSQTVYMMGVWMPAGTVVNAISIVTGATASQTQTNSWVALYNSSLSLLGQCTDRATTVLAANTCYRQALTAPQTCTYTGLYYLAFYNYATTQASQPCVIAGTVNMMGNITGMTPILAATSNTSLASATAPSTATSLSAITQLIYMFVD